jgi:hypothetical protein
MTSTTDLIAFGKRLATAKLEEAGCRVTPPGNPREGKLAVRTPSGRRVEVFVSTQRIGGYAFWTKRRLQPAADRFAVVVLFDAAPSSRLYLVPSTEWDHARSPLTDRDYVDQASEPEYGIELGRSRLDQLEQYAWDDRRAAEHFA